MNTLEYKGYFGSVEYSDSDKMYFGKVKGVNDLVSYEGRDIFELTRDFQDAVDDYLQLGIFQNYSVAL